MPLQNTLDWFTKAVPSPDRKSFNVQLGVHVEEFGEMLEELTAQTPHGKDLVAGALYSVQQLATWLKTNPNGVVVDQDDRKAFLDSICDQLVTATGAAYQQGMDVVAAMEEQINPSNWSKFVDGEAIFDENGKIAKGPDYFKADLSSYV